jgi:hypothetical protein
VQGPLSGPDQQESPTILQGLWQSSSFQDLSARFEDGYEGLSHTDHDLPNHQGPQQTEAGLHLDLSSAMLPQDPTTLPLTAFSTHYFLTTDNTNSHLQVLMALDLRTKPTQEFANPVTHLRPR